VFLAGALSRTVGDHADGREDQTTDGGPGDERHREKQPDFEAPKPRRKTKVLHCAPAPIDEP
jgi:hypothetical protein